MPSGRTCRPFVGRGRRALYSKLGASADDFDFWLGTWTVRWGATERETGHNVITRGFGDHVVEERFDGRPAIDLVGMSVSVFFHHRELWRQTWVDDEATTSRSRATASTANGARSARTTRARSQTPCTECASSRSSATPYVDVGALARCRHEPRSATAPRLRARLRRPEALRRGFPRRCPARPGLRDPLPAPRVSQASAMRSRSSSRSMRSRSVIRNSTALYPFQCGVVKNTPRSSATMISFSPRSATLKTSSRRARPPASESTASGRGLRCQQKTLPWTAYEGRPSSETPLVACGIASASSSRSRIVAMPQVCTARPRGDSSLPSSERTMAGRRGSSYRP